PERHHAVLGPLAATHMDELLLEVHVAQIEAHSLGAAEAGGVDELDERSVPKRERPLALERRQLALDLRGTRRIRQPPPTSRREARIRHAGGAERMAQERPDGRELARDRRGSELAAPAPGRAEFPGVRDQRPHIDVAERRSLLVEPAAKL